MELKASITLTSLIPTQPPGPLLLKLCRNFWNEGEPRHLVGLAISASWVTNTLNEPAARKTAFPYSASTNAPNHDFCVCTVLKKLSSPPLSSIAECGADLSRLISS